MTNYMGGMTPGQAELLGSYAKANYALRDAKEALLRQYGAAHPEDVLEKIRSGVLPAHPAYEHYLGMRVLDQTRDAMRADVMAQLRSEQ